MKYIFWMGVIPLIIFISCNKPSSIGSGFLEDDEIGLGFTDTFNIKTKLVKPDSLIVYAPGAAVVSAYSCGRIDDPVFGQTESEIYTQLGIGSIQPVISESIVDSIVLTLAYDTTSFYAYDTTKRFSFEVYRVIEEMSAEQTAYSNQQYEVGDLLGGIYDYKIDPKSNRTIVEPEVGSPVDTTTYVPHIRIPLKNEFGKELIDLDTTDFTTPTGFREYFKGLRISATEDTDGMLAFDMNEGISRVSLYYQRVNDTRRYDFDLTSINKRTIHIDHNYNPEFEDKIENEEDSDSLIYFQGLAGVRTEFQVDGITELPPDVIVNKAELLLQGPLNTNELFPPSEQLITFVENSEGNLVWISDIIPDFNDPTAISAISGGFLNENSDFLTYRINLTSHIQRILNGEVGTSFTVSVHPSVGVGSRVILFGPESQVAPPKLEIVYTLLP